MASRTAQQSRNIYEEPFWKTPAAKIFVTCLVLVLSVLGIQKLERINARHQVEARLSRDPALGPMVEKWRNAIASTSKAKAGPGDELPVALYFGEVLEYIETKPRVGDLKPSRLLKLQRPQLLAGTNGRNDKRDLVEIAFRRYSTGMNKPKPGEEWLLAISRDSDGNNVVHTAYRCDAPKN